MESDTLMSELYVAPTEIGANSVSENTEVVDLWEDVDDDFRSGVDGVDWEKMTTTLVANALEKMGDIELRVNSIKMEATAKIAGIQEQKDKMVRRQERKIAYLKWRVADPMEVFLKEQIAAGGKKSYGDTLYGTIGLRKAKDQFKVLDKEMALEWARLNLPDAVVTQTIESVPNKVLNGYFTESGEMPGGCEHIKGEEHLYFTPSSTKKTDTTGSSDPVED